MNKPIILMLALLLVACDSGQTDEEVALADDNYAESTDYEDEERGGETYDEFDERRDSYEGEYGSVGDYGCTVDCSGHDAGYQWAADKGITEPEDCGGKSWSFEEGCRAYAEEQS